jgi:hydrogenase expression/formation protein HypE
MNTALEKLLPGKLPHSFLYPLLKKYTFKDTNVFAGAQIGEDAAVVDAGDHFLILKTDPITFVTDEIGYYAVHVNSNDILCMGGTPLYFLATLLLPADSTPAAVEMIFKQISVTCRKQNICYCGGHTEITLGLDRPIVVGQMVGKAAKEELLLKSSIEADDHILLINESPIEATSIIARVRGTELEKAFSTDFMIRCRNALFQPGISVRPAAEIAFKTAPLHALHDPTEGGIATALYEVAMSVNLGFRIYYDQIPFLPEGKLLCDHYDLNPLGCIASGSLLAFVPARSVNRLLTAFHKQDIPAADIGIMTKNECEKTMIIAGEETALPIFQQDEIVKIVG